VPSEDGKLGTAPVALDSSTRTPDQAMPIQASTDLATHNANALPGRPAAWAGLALIATTLIGCNQPAIETPQAKAKPGDTLVRVETQKVTLIKPFRQGEPNGLFDGVVSIHASDGNTGKLMEINVVCSVPDEPGWPSYDNIYGRRINDADQAKGRSGDTEWQVLYSFSGKEEIRMGSKPGPWVSRLRDNLCRRGNFDDRATARQ